MTAVILPEFMLKALEVEIAKVSLEVVKIVCEDYDLPFDEVKARLGNKVQIELHPENNDDYRIIRRRHRKTVVPIDQMCIANMFDKDHKCVRRCTRAIKDDTMFCRSHLRMSKVGRLRFGVVDTEKQHD